MQADLGSNKDDAVDPIVDAGNDTSDSEFDDSEDDEVHAGDNED